MADWAGVGHMKVMIEWTSVINLYATMDYTWQNDQQGAAPDPNTALQCAAVLQLLAAAAIIVHNEYCPEAQGTQENVVQRMAAAQTHPRLVCKINGRTTPRRSVWT